MDYHRKPGTQFSSEEQVNDEASQKHIKQQAKHGINRKNIKTVRKVIKKVVDKLVGYKKTEGENCNLLLNKKSSDCENIYVSLASMKTHLNPVFKLDQSECPSCIFGDPSLTCTCNFRSNSPDFKLYEDEDMLFKLYEEEDVYAASCAQSDFKNQRPAVSQSAKT